MSKNFKFYKKYMKREKNKICILGLGYIGLPTAAILSSNGYIVTGVDVNSNVIETINEGKIHIIEPGLEEIVKKSVKNNSLVAQLNPIESDVFLIAVPTPFKDGYVPNIDFVLEATRSISHLLKPGDLIILESTSPVGTTDKIKEELEKLKFDTSSIFIAHCPERVLPGNIVKEIVENDRIVGGIDQKSTEVAANFYKTFVKGQVLETTAKTAELCKLVENSFRDVNIAFANELSMICDSAQVNVWELISLANRHPRVNILNPGPGVGGHCIAVDPWFIVNDFPESSHLIKTARIVNNNKKEWVYNNIINQIEQFEKNELKFPTIGIFGLTFKADIDDYRESPSLDIYNMLIEKFGENNILAVDPNLENSNLKDKIKPIDEAVEQCDLIFILVAHKQFLNLALTKKNIVINYTSKS